MEDKENLQSFGMDPDLTAQDKVECLDIDCPDYLDCTFEQQKEEYNFAQQNIPQSPEPIGREKREKSFITRKMAVAVLALSVVFSGTLGFGGGLLAGAIGGNEVSLATDQTKTPSSSNSSSLLPVATANSGKTLSIVDVARLTADSVVEISTETVSTSRLWGQSVGEGAGSGVIVAENGYIVTNNHVIEGATTINVRLKNGKSYPATLIGTDSKMDIAVLKIEATGLQPAVFGDSDTLQVGEVAVAIGNPLGELGGTVTDGIISALDREIQLDDGNVRNLLQTNAAINPGNSGGGLFNGSGELIGIVVAKSAGSDIEGLGFVIPINDAKSVIEQLMNYGYVQGRIDLGLSLVDITDGQTAMAYRVRQLGLYVSEVSAGSAAQKAGFQPGDCLLSLDGKEIADSASLSKLLENYKVGDQVTFSVLRSGKTLSLTFTLPQYVPGKTSAA